VTNLDLSKWVNKFAPDLPGVYRMLNKANDVLYVGKAINLKKRLKSYFTRQQVIKTQKLMLQVHTIEYTVTNSEKEALLLESTLIKDLKPKYNILLRDDKTYPYIYIDTAHDFPKMVCYRNKRKPRGNDYFGPYPDANSAYQAIEWLQAIFKIRNCRDSMFKNRSRPCIQYEINRCTAPCVKYITKENYRSNINNVIEFLQGTSKNVLKNIQAELKHAVKNLEFERACILRDQINAMQQLQEKQAVVASKGEVDVLYWQVLLDLIIISWVKIRDGKVLTTNTLNFKLPVIYEHNDYELLQNIFEAWIRFKYLDNIASLPKKIIVVEKPKNYGLIEAWLKDISGKTCIIKKANLLLEKSWLKIAEQNLKQYVAELQHKHSLDEQRWQALEQYLHTHGSLKTIECFDISHTMGQHTMASCVVFDKHGPRKQDYRQFAINDITPGDDYAAMQQVLMRRLRYYKQHSFPSIILIDGGKGQISVAKKVFAEITAESCKIIGIAKGVSRKPGLEKLIFTDSDTEQTLPADSKALHILQAVRDEAHRFALKSHRRKRDKKNL
jgi:excinuclease ABC subunit C